jgi:hypothetical protein
MSEQKLPEYLKIKHINMIDSFTISIEKCKKSKYILNYIDSMLVLDSMIISDINEEIFKFIIEYINYKDIELDPPEMPLRDGIHIAMLFNDSEYDIFANIYNPESNINDNLNKINNYMIATETFQFKNLQKKLSAIAAFAILQTM